MGTLSQKIKKAKFLSNVMSIAVAEKNVETVILETTLSLDFFEGVQGFLNYRRNTAEGEEQRIKTQLAKVIGEKFSFVQQSQPPQQSQGPQEE